MRSLRDCVSKDPHEAELYVVSSARPYDFAAESRDRISQAVLFIDVSQVPSDTTEVDELLLDPEFQRLVSTLGVGVDLSRFWEDRHPETFDLEKLRYHKILLLVDDSSRGAKLREQLLTWLFLYFRPLLENGYVYLFEEMPDEEIALDALEERFMRPELRTIRRVVVADTLEETLSRN